jgi:hypothetical protein
MGTPSTGIEQDVNSVSVGSRFTVLYDEKVGSVERYRNRYKIKMTL